jgi:hypothetical protein
MIDNFIIEQVVEEDLSIQWDDEGYMDFESFKGQSCFKTLGGLKRSIRAMASEYPATGHIIRIGKAGKYWFAYEREVDLATLEKMREA